MEHEIEGQPRDWSSGQKMKLGIIFDEERAYLIHVFRFGYGKQGQYL